MLKKILILTALLGLLMASVQAKDKEPSAFIKATGGVIATGDNWENGKIIGSFNAEILRLIFGNAAIGFKYKNYGDMTGDLDQYAGQVYYFAYSPKHSSDKISPYFFLGAGGTHGVSGSENSFADFTWDGGLGILFPDWDFLQEANAVFEIGFKQVNGVSMVGISVGFQSGLDF